MELWLGGNQLTGEIPPELGGLSNLTQLILDHNQLTGEIPPELGGLSNLEVLYLDHNQLTGEIPPELGGLSKLTLLFLRGNQLTGCIPEGLRDIAENDLGDLNLPDCGSVTGPEAPRGLTATADGQTRIDLSWTAPSDNGGAAITGYRIEVSEDGSNWSDLVANTRSTSASYSHTGLTAGSARHYRVSAINSAGTGPASNVDNATTDTQQDTSACATGGAVPDAADNPGLVSDCEALLAGKDTLVGTGTLNWSADVSMVNWDGVSVGNSPTRVLRLNLAENQLTGEIPPELGGLSFLTGLWLSENQLTGEIPTELGDLSNLTGLGLGGNRLTGGRDSPELGGLVQPGGAEIPPELGGLSNLEVLYLDNNQLTGEIPPELGRLGFLRRLLLHSNRLTGEIPPELGRLGFLQSLVLDSNQLTGEIPPELGRLGFLELLVLSRNQLTGEIPPELGGLFNLTGLYLSNNQLTGCIPEALRDIAENDLVELNLPDCTTATPPGAPTGLTATADGQTRIDLSWTAPSDDGGATITGYKVEVSTNGSSWSNLVANTRSTSASYTHSGLAAGSTRQYRVSAINSAGTSTASNVDNATTDTQQDTSACATGGAVPDAADNPGLVSDCEALLAGKDTLVGTGDAELVRRCSDGELGRRFGMELPNSGG